MIITIDGLAASGKCTLAKRLSAYFKLPYMDTGKMYRYVAWAVAQHKLRFKEDLEAVLRIIEAAEYSDIAQNQGIYEEGLGEMASKIAACPAVRKALITKQRCFACDGSGAVLDGRDAGTAICPEADFKFYTCASVHFRAKRRYKELRARNRNAMYASVLKAIIKRDLRDKKRSCNPAIIPPDAVVIDTSLLSPDDVFQIANSHITSNVDDKINLKRQDNRETKGQ